MKHLGYTTVRVVLLRRYSLFKNLFSVLTGLKKRSGSGKVFSYLHHYTISAFPALSLIKDREYVVLVHAVAHLRSDAILG